MELNVEGGISEMSQGKKMPSDPVVVDHMPKLLRQG